MIYGLASVLRKQQLNGGDVEDSEEDERLQNQARKSGSTWESFREGTVLADLEERTIDAQLSVANSTIVMKENIANLS